MKRRPRLGDNVERFAAAEARTKAWLAQNGADLVGLREHDALKAADLAGISVRVISRDGHGFALTADLRPDRINVTLADGRVSHVDGAY